MLASVFEGSNYFKSVFLPEINCAFVRCNDKIAWRDSLFYSLLLRMDTHFRSNTLTSRVTSNDVTTVTNMRTKAGLVLFKNKPYAKTLKAIANKGSDGFYEGKITRAIAAAVQEDVAIAGDMTVEDLANYDVVERDPVCIDYRGHNICGMGPPSSGALAVGQILGILENFELMSDPLDVKNVHLFTQAGRLAFADRGLYVGDPDFALGMFILHDNSLVYDD